MSSSFISSTQSVHIWHNDCLWGVDYNVGFLSPLCHWCQKTRSNILTIILWLVTRTSPSFFLTSGVHTWHNYCLWCVNYKVRYISPLWPWSQRLIRICLTVACFWQRCFIFCRIIDKLWYFSLNFQNNLKPVVWIVKQYLYYVLL